MDTHEQIDHRERVLRAIKHQKVDRVPFDFWAEQPSIERLRSFCREKYLDRILENFGVDIRHIDAGALSEVRDISELENFYWPVPDDLDYSGLMSACSKYDEYALMYGFADIWLRPWLVRGMENALLDLYVNPEWVHFLSRKFTDFYIEDYKNAYKHSDGRIDIFLVISDLGSQSSPLISPAMFDEFVAPYLKELLDCIHGLGAFTMFHSCGMIFSFIECLIDIGIDILDPIQPVAPELSPENLKAKFSGRICFHGGIDTQKVLSRGSPEDVKEEIQRYLEVFGNDGGYICGPSHLFQPDVPPENIAAFYDKSLRDRSLTSL
jgi:uroporphyrinogen decarboxylase